MIRQSTTTKVVLTLAAALAFGGCMLDADEPLELDEIGDVEELRGLADEELEITAPALALVSGWTEFASEEDPPLACDSPGMVAGFACSSHYCDNVSLYCRDPGISGSTVTYWTSYFSEEGTNYRYCDDRYWITGLTCSGGYCDNLSLQCRYYGGSSPSDCYWTGWMSEEHGGTLYFGAGYYARGVQCRGDYCDDKRFYVCQL